MARYVSRSSHRSHPEDPIESGQLPVAGGRGPGAVFDLPVITEAFGRHLAGLLRDHVARGSLPAANVALPLHVLLRVCYIS